MLLCVILSVPQGHRSMRLTQPGAQSWTMSHGRDSCPAHGRQGEILVVLGNQLSLFPALSHGKTHLQQCSSPLDKAKA